MRIFTRVILLGIIVPAIFLFRSAAAESPHIRMENGTGQLIVNGQPFLILGGELGNSSSGTAEQADAIVPRLRSMHVNTILMPVTWEQIEPKEGSFDFDILDHWVERAREHKMHPAARPHLLRKSRKPLGSPRAAHGETRKTRGVC